MIERLYVQNFRCLENLTLDFSGKSSVLLIGSNGSGKSTIRDALAVLQGICRGSGRVDKLISRSDFLLQRTEEPMRFGIRVEISGKRFEYKVSFDWIEKFREAWIQDEGFSVDGNVVFVRELATVELTNGPSFGLYQHVFALTIVTEKPPERSIQDFKAFLASLVLVAPVPRNMTGFSEISTTELSADASNFASCLRGLIEKKPAAYGHFADYIRSVIPDFSSIGHEDRGKDGKQLMVSFKRPETDDAITVEFDALSDGEKCFFLSAYIIASNAAGFPIVCMWDEPDNHLSLSEVGHFITALRKNAKRNGQLIVTSHHPETVRSFSDETTFVCTRSSHLDPTRVRLLEETGYEGDLVHALMRGEIIGDEAIR